VNNKKTAAPSPDTYNPKTSFSSAINRAPIYGTGTAKREANSAKFLAKVNNPAPGSYDKIDSQKDGPKYSTAAKLILVPGKYSNPTGPGSYTPKTTSQTTSIFYSLQGRGKDLSKK